MSADFWAGYISGAAGIIIGNPLDIVKVNLQRGKPATISTPTSPLSSSSPTLSPTSSSNPSIAPSTTVSRSPKQIYLSTLSSLLKGTTAPILGYGALNALMFMTYNRTLLLLSDSPSSPSSLSKTFFAGALGGLATFFVSAPTELVKCRAQVAREDRSRRGGAVDDSWRIARELWRKGGIKALYWGGGVTSLRDSVGYGFYFWSYELSKRTLLPSPSPSSSNPNEKPPPEWMTILLCGGIAGVVTWASVFPLDVIKTRVQTQGIAFETLSPPSPSHPQPSASTSENSTLLPRTETRLTTMQIAKQAYREEGLQVFFRGLGVCSVRAFFVNAVQWAVYEWIMHILVVQQQDSATN